MKLMFTLSAEKLNFVFLLALAPPMSPVLRALASPKGLKGKNPRPSAAVRRILGAKKPTKGGRRPKAAAAPFVGFRATQNCSDWCWSLGFFPFNPFGFPFNPFGLARALKTGLIGGALRARRNTKFNFEANYLCCVRKCKHKFHGLVGPPGAIFEKNTTCKTKKKSFEFQESL